MSRGSVIGKPSVVGGDLVERYQKARALEGYACLEECATILWAHWAGIDPASRPATSGVGSDGGPVVTLLGHVHRGDSISLDQWRTRESAAWRTVPLDGRAAWQLLLSAFTVVSPTFVELLQVWQQAQRIGWIEESDPLGACCFRTSSGVQVRAPRPSNLGFLALLAHELGHALHEHHQPGALANTLHAETVAMACERWVLAWVLGNQSDLQTARAVHAWLAARQYEFVGRHAMLSNFELKLGAQCALAEAPVPVEWIGATWLGHNETFFGPRIALSPSFASGWTEVQLLFLAPGAVAAYPPAWVASAELSNPIGLRHSIRRGLT